MALQAAQLVRLLRAERIDAFLLASNYAFPQGFRFLDRLPAIRTLARFAILWARLSKRVPQSDVVHVLAASWAYFFLVVYPAAAVARIFRKRLVVNYRGGEAATFFRRYGWLATPVFRLADAITAPSEFIAGVIRDRFGVKVSIVPNILDTSLFTYRRRKTIQPRILSTRHLEKMYDIESVLRAFEVVQSRHPNASLRIAGTGSEEGRLRILVQSLGLKNVRFLGHVPHRELPAVYDECDILVNASSVDNFPASLVEASAAGLAVVSTKVGGIPYLYQHGCTALLVEPGDWRGLATEVEQLLQDPTLAFKLIVASAAVARSFDWREIRPAVYSAYGFSPDRK